MTGEDSEKRFHSIMDKLFQSPKPKPTTTTTSNNNSNNSSPGNQSSRGKKRGDLMKNGSDSNASSGSIITVGGFKRSAAPVGSSLPSEGTLCRPWNRGDLLRRLATFKSMTWFGKPKVVSAVNCARRGWINVEMDIIACEACGTRLLFSTPSSWSHHQIEKAAAVFSLKLDSGHKPLCPWIDNACDEKLVQFPPAPTPALADGYKERSLALLKLYALPKVSSSAIDYMSNPQLESFLTKSSTVELGLGLTDTSTTEYLGSEQEAVSSQLYYQAQKVIALCGWEPRLLPYVVECEDPVQATENTHSKDSTGFVTGRSLGIVTDSMCSNEIMEVDEEHRSLIGQPSDPASVVLDCKLCGSSVGLWAFSTVQRPLELYRLIGSSEVNGKNDSGNCDVIIHNTVGTTKTDDAGKENHVDCNGGINSATSTKERSLNLNLSIAGGPPPAKQNYRATVSLPIISRHLRAGLSSNSHARDLSSMYQGADNSLLSSNQIQKENNQTTNNSCRQIVLRDDVGTLKRKRTEDGDCKSGGDDQSCNNNVPNENDPHTKKNDDLEQTLHSGHTLGASPVTTMENAVENMAKKPKSSGTTKLDANAGTAEEGVESTSQSTECLAIGSDATKSVENGATDENNSLIMTNGEVSNHQQNQNVSEMDFSHTKTFEDSHQESSGDALMLQQNVAADQVNSGEGGTDKDLLMSSDQVGGVKNTVPSSVNNEMVALQENGRDIKTTYLDQPMEFDPIRQHRHFCPWIMSLGNSPPGWQQTLSAVVRGNESSPLLKDSNSSPSKLEVDDPILSVRRLFMSPSAKKKKRSNDEANR